MERISDTFHQSLARRYQLITILVAAVIFGGCATSPPSLMDDVDAVQAQIARTMLESGDWVTARLNGVAYLEKAPLKYWMIAVSFAIFGVHDWAARIPIVLSTIALCWLTARVAAWAYSPLTGLYAGLVLATSIGLWLFTRVLIPDVVLTLTITLALYGFLRARPYLFWISLALGFLLKGLIALVFPIATVALYWTVTRSWGEWRSLRPFTGPLLALAIAAPWAILATLRNPPYFDFTWRSAPGEYHGFFWFFFLNEHVFRFLNMRHPRDYNTVPRLAFWLFHLLWIFPWSVWFLRVFRKPADLSDRARRTRLLCFCWAGFVLIFFTFSTTQEYYSMPCYPALALLLAPVLTTSRGIQILSALISIVLFTLFALTRSYATPGDISQALTLNPEAYTLSLGHLRDLTLPAFAYLRTPLLLAAIAFAIATAGRVLALTTAMILFFHAARLALITFDPYLSSRPLAQALKQSPAGEVIIDNQYYTFSSIFFYADLKRAWLLNGRLNNLEYGSYAPNAPQVFLNDDQFVEKWRSPQLHYLFIEGPSVPRLKARVELYPVHSSGGKFLFANHSLGTR